MIAARVADASVRLTGAERRVAEHLLADPSSVAFGTVASLASAADTSGPTVVRLATKLGFEGFSALQEAVQLELSARLQPAVQRIRAPHGAGALERARQLEADNVHATLASVDQKTFDSAVRAIAERRRSVFVLSGESTAGIAAHFADGLSLLRDGVHTVGGSPVAVARGLTFLQPRDVVVAIEVRRYESWTVEAVNDARDRGASVIALTDSPLSPLARDAFATFLVAAEGPGPFDSHTSTLALLNALIAGTADRLSGSSATVARLDAFEAALADHLQD